MSIAAQVFGYIGAIITVGLGIPQLVYQLKAKKTGKVNFFSFWIFYIGLLMWTALGVWHNNDATSISIFVSNFICGIIYTFTMYFLYHFYSKKTKHMMTGVISSISTIAGIYLILFIAFILRWTIPTKFAKLDGVNALIISLIAPAFTTLAFLPQFITGMRKKDFHGVSPYMALLFLFNCVVWLLHFIFSVVSKDTELINVVGMIVWQCISFTINSLQFIYIKKYSKGEEKNETIEMQKIDEKTKEVLFQK